METNTRSRRPGVIAATFAIAVTGWAGAEACAQAWPSKPVRIIAASSPGSAVDIVVRILAQKLAEPLGQQVIVDNRAGAGGNLGAELAAKAPPDGYTLFIGSPAHAINTGLYRKLNYDLLRDFAPVSQVTTGAYMVVVHPSLPAKTLKELAALARARPGQLNFSSAGAGNATHLAGELFKSLTKTSIEHVPYKGGGPAMTDLIGGQVQIMFPNLTQALPQVKTGRIRALAVTSEKRSPSAPDVPTGIESGLPGYVVTSWFGILVPAGTPREIVMRLNGDLVQTLRAPDVRDKLAGDGAEPVTSTPEQFGLFLRSEVDKWTRVIREAKIAPE